MVMAFADDQFSPIGYFDRSAWHAGLYLSQFPKIPKIGSTSRRRLYGQSRFGGNVGHGFYYFNFTWLSGYTNNGKFNRKFGLAGTGQGAQALDKTIGLPRANRFAVQFQHQKVQSTIFCRAAGH